MSHLPQTAIITMMFTTLYIPILYRKANGFSFFLKAYIFFSSDKKTTMFENIFTPLSPYSQHQKKWNNTKWMDVNLELYCH